MAKANSKKEQAAKIGASQAASQSAYGKYLNPIIDRNQGLYDEGVKERGYLTKNYQDIVEGRGGTSDDINRMRDDFLANIGAAPRANLQDFAKERGVYNEFADTGGYNAADIQRIRAQAATSAPNLYKAMQNQYALNRANLGANANAGAGIDFKGMRDSAKQSAQDRLTANIGLTGEINKGRITGAEGLTNIDTTMGNQSLENERLMSDYGYRKATGLADIDKYGLDAKGGALDALQKLYGTNYKPYTDNMDFYQSGLKDWDNSQQNWQKLSLDNDVANKSSLWSNIIGGMGSVGGAAKGASQLWPLLKNLFKGKDKGKAPVTGTGGGGGGEDATLPDWRRFQFSDPFFNQKSGAEQEAEMRRMFDEYQKTKERNESFEQWLYRNGYTSSANPGMS